MGRSSKPRHAHRARLIKLPMMKTLHDQLALDLHTAFAALSISPAKDQFDIVGHYLNTIGLTIEGDPRFPVELKIIESAIRAMNQIVDSWERTNILRPTAIELLPVRNAVFVCDQIVSRLDLTKIHISNKKLATMKARA
jgi:hypothetical protein